MISILHVHVMSMIITMTVSQEHANIAIHCANYALIPRILHAKNVIPSQEYYHLMSLHAIATQLGIIMMMIPILVSNATLYAHNVLEI